MTIPLYNKIRKFRAGFSGGRWNDTRAKQAGFLGFDKTPIHSGEAWLAAHNLLDQLNPTQFAQPNAYEKVGGAEMLGR